MPKKITIKTRNAGTMTESAFFGYIRNGLRKLSMYRKPISIAKAKSKRAYKGPNKKQKYEYQCNICKQRFLNKIGKKSQIQVDHIIECGTLTCFNDLPGFCERLFCEVDGLQTICSNCHNLKTKKAKDETTH